LSESNLVQDIRVIAAEVRKHGGGLEKKPRWLIFNKMDAVNDADQRIAKALRALRWTKALVQSVRHQRAGCDAVMKAVAKN
jgi:GTPase involved in cell partitioning and DNA repair